MATFKDHLPFKQEGTDAFEDWPAMEETFMCSLCGYKFSQEKYLTNHFNLCKSIANPADRLGPDAIDPLKCESVKEEVQSGELDDQPSTIEPTLDIKIELELDFAETTISSAACPLSGKPVDILKTTDELEDHIEVHDSARCTVEKPFKCVICDYASVTRSKLQRHILTHTGEKLFNCKECGLAFTRRWTLERHILTHTGQKLFNCKECGLTFTRCWTLERHMVRIHKRHKKKIPLHKKKRRTIEKSFNCEICGYVFARHLNLQRHMLTHTVQKIFNCDLCEYASKRHDAFHQHMLKHTGVKKFNCEICDITSTRRNDSQPHMVVDFTETTSESNRALSGEPVAILMTAEEPTRLGEHITVHETPEKPQKSNKCDAIPAKHRFLKTNKQIPIGKESGKVAVGRRTLEKPYNCENCGLAIVNSSHLRRHTLTHTGEERLACKECDLDFASDCDLRQHMLKHTRDTVAVGRRTVGKPFNCENCGLAIINRSHLRRHTLTHTGEERLACKECDLDFASDCDLRQHMVKHTRDTVAVGRRTVGKPFNCENCGLPIINRSHLRRHTLTHTGEARLACKECDLDFASDCDLRQHTLKHTRDTVAVGRRTVGKPFNCENCGLPIINRSHLRRHTFTHTGEERLACKECDLDFASDCDLRQHMLKHTRDTGAVGRRTVGKPFNCENCGLAIINRSHLRRHTLAHTGEERLACKECYLDFASDCDLRQHMLKHTRDTGAVGRRTVGTPFNCENCGLAIINRSHLRRHTLTHTGEERLDCKECYLDFASDCDLRQHMLKHTRDNKESGKVGVGSTTVEKQFVCEICGLAFKTPAILRRHKHTHTGEKRVDCKECGRAFAHQWVLRRHMIRHTGEKRFDCEVCGQRFAVRWTLQQHIINKHTRDKNKSGKVAVEEKPFKCKICDYACSYRANLRVHILTHTGEKEFDCKECGRAFARQCSLRRHMLTHTRPKKKSRKVGVERRTVKKRSKCEIHDNLQQALDFTETTSDSSGALSGQPVEILKTAEQPARLEEHIAVRETPEKPQKSNNCETDPAKHGFLKTNKQGPIGKESGNVGVEMYTIEIPFNCEIRDNLQQALDFTETTSDSSGALSGQPVETLKTAEQPARLEEHIAVRETPEKPQKSNNCETIPAKHGFLKTNKQGPVGKEPGNVGVEMCTIEKPFSCEIRDNLQQPLDFTETTSDSSGALSGQPVEILKTAEQPARLENHIAVHETPEKPQKSNKCETDPAKHGFLKTNKQGPIGKESGKVDVEKCTIEEPFNCEIRDNLRQPLDFTETTSDSSGALSGQPVEIVKTAEQPARLEDHIAVHETPEKPQKSNKCDDQRPIEKESCKMGVEISTGKKSFNCGICDVTFKTYYNLRRHLLTHTGEKRFDCKECGFAFTRQCSLRRHMLNKHMGEKQLNCVICDYTSARRDQLQRHMLRHAEGQEFNCELCDFVCICRSKFQQHMLKHT